MQFWRVPLQYFIITKGGGGLLVNGPILWYNGHHSDHGKGVFPGPLLEA